jgi:hypothetical protein
MINAIIHNLDTSNTEALDDDLHNAGCLFEKAAGMGSGFTPAEQALRFAWTSEVTETTIVTSDIDRLHEAIVAFISRRPPTTLLISALWALSKRGDLQTKPVLIATLAHCVNHEQAALFQAMIALANSGEDVFGQERSLSDLDVEKNRALALAYLQRQGQ